MVILPTIEDADARRTGYHYLREEFSRRHYSFEKRVDFFDTCLLDSDFSIRFESAITLSLMDNTVTIGIPILLNAITNRNLPALTHASFRPSQGFLENVTLQQQRAHIALERVSRAIAAPPEVLLIMKSITE